MHTIITEYDKMDYSGDNERPLIYLFSTKDKAIKFTQEFIISYDSRDKYYCKLNQYNMYMEILLGIDLEFVNIRYEKLIVDSDKDGNQITGWKLPRHFIDDSCSFDDIKKGEYKKFLKINKINIKLITKEMFDYYFISGNKRRY